MGSKLRKSKDKPTSSQLTNYTTKTTGPAVAHSSKGLTGTYAEKGGRAAAASKHGSAWSKSVSYGGDYSDDDSRNSSSRQVSQRTNYTYTSGDAVAGVIEGGTFTYAGPGGYAEAAYRDGSRYSASVSHGGDVKGEKRKKKNDGIEFRGGDLMPFHKSSLSNRSDCFDFDDFFSIEEGGEDLSDDDEGRYHYY